MFDGSSCINGLLGSNNHYTLAGGTSFAAPMFAGLITILNQVEHATGQGNINPLLYGLAADPATYAAVFHDISSGTNACVAGAGTCAAAGQSNYGATVGYDQATGLGSVDFNALVKAWPAATTAKITSTLILLIAFQTTAAPGDTVPISISVQSFDPPSDTSIPSGSVSISVDGAVVAASLPLGSAAPNYPNARATYNFVAPASSGSHVITGTYSGDATHAPSKASYSMLVGNVLASGGLTLAAGNLTISNPGTGSTQVTATPNAGYNGRLVWSLSYSGNGPQLTACYAIASLPVNNVSRHDSRLVSELRATLLRRPVGVFGCSVRAQLRTTVHLPTRATHPQRRYTQVS